MPQAKLDLTGRTFGRLTVIEPAPVRIVSQRKRTAWFCECACGTQRHSVLTTHLVRGQVSSCGCAMRGGRTVTDRRRAHGWRSREASGAMSC